MHKKGDADNVPSLLSMWVGGRQGNEDGVGNIELVSQYMPTLGSYLSSWKPQTVSHRETTQSYSRATALYTGIKQQERTVYTCK